MWRILIAAILLAGCTQLPPTPQDIQAKKFENVSGKSVIYLVRDDPDFNNAATTLWLGEERTITTYPGTYYRWEVAPGAHRIAGFAGDSGAITMRVEPDRIYYVQQRVTPFTLGYATVAPTSRFQVIPEASGRTVVSRSQLIP